MTAFVNMGLSTWHYIFRWTFPWKLFCRFPRHGLRQTVVKNWRHHTTLGWESQISEICISKINPKAQDLLHLKIETKDKLCSLEIFLSLAPVLSHGQFSLRAAPNRVLMSSYPYPPSSCTMRRILLLQAHHRNPTTMSTTSGRNSPQICCGSDTESSPSWTRPFTSLGNNTLTAMVAPLRRLAFREFVLSWICPFVNLSFRDAIGWEWPVF